MASTLVLLGLGLFAIFSSAWRSSVVRYLYIVAIGLFTGFTGCASILGVDDVRYKEEDPGKEKVDAVPVPDDAGSGSMPEAGRFALMTAATADASGDARQSGGDAMADVVQVGDADPLREAGSVEGGEGGDACTLTQHDDGVGYTWSDCAALTTYTEDEAMNACQSRTGATGDCFLSASLCPGIPLLVFESETDPQYAWVYGGSHAGEVLVISACTFAGNWK